jgi:hypothetical protein
VPQRNDSASAREFIAPIHDFYSDRLAATILRWKTGTGMNETGKQVRSEPYP